MARAKTQDTKGSKKNIGKIIKDLIVNIIMGMSIIIFAIALYSGYVHKDNPNEAFLLGYKPVYVMTGSMEPTLKVNGLVIIKQIDYDDVKVDDIIMYEIDDKMITHRVVEITDEGIRTKGDNNNVQDAYLLQPENIKGKAVDIWNWTAKIANMFSTAKGRTQLIIIGVFVVCLILFIIGIRIVINAKNSPSENTKKSKENKSKIESSTKQISNHQQTALDTINVNEKEPLIVMESVSIPSEDNPRKALSEEESNNTIYVPTIYFERK